MYLGSFMRTSITILIIAASSVACVSCSMTHDEKNTKQIDTVAKEFGSHYFNYELKEAKALTTTDSQQWIDFFASNIDSTTVDIIRQQEKCATVSIDDIQLHTPDDATVYITVNNFVWQSSIEESPKITEEGHFILHLKKEAQQWRVKMDNLRQSGKQNRDQSQDE